MSQTEEGFVSPGKYTVVRHEQGRATLTEMGMVIREYGRKLYGREYELSRNTLKLAEEAGEYVQAANRYMGYTVDRKFGSRGALAEELADVVICAFTCAATLDIDLGAAIDEKYREAVRLFSAELDTPQG